MADFDRLSQLRHQRKLVAEHLSWLDQQIADATHGSATASPANPTALPVVASPEATVAATPTADSPLPASPELSTDVEQWIERERNSAPISKTGCWWIFGLVMLAIVCGTIFAVLAIYR